MKSNRKSKTTKTKVPRATHEVIKEAINRASPGGRPMTLREVMEQEEPPVREPLPMPIGLYYYYEREPEPGKPAYACGQIVGTDGDWLLLREFDWQGELSREIAVIARVDFYDDDDCHLFYDEQAMREAMLTARDARQATVEQSTQEAGGQ